MRNCAYLKRKSSGDWPGNPKRNACSPRIAELLPASFGPKITWNPPRLESSSGWSSKGPKQRKTMRTNFMEQTPKASPAAKPTCSREDVIQGLLESGANVGR